MSVGCEISEKAAGTAKEGNFVMYLCVFWAIKNGVFADLIGTVSASIKTS